MRTARSTTSGRWSEAPPPSSHVRGGDRDPARSPRPGRSGGSGRARDGCRPRRGARTASRPGRRGCRRPVQASVNRSRSRASSGASGRGVEVADDDAGLHRLAVQRGERGHLGGPVLRADGGQVGGGDPQRGAVELDHRAQGRPRLPAAGQRVHVADQDRQPRQQGVAVLPRRARRPAARRSPAPRPAACPAPATAAAPGRRPRCGRRSAGRPPAGR